MKQLGNGLYDAKHYEEALAVQETELSTLRRICASELHVLVTQSNLANTYQNLGRHEEALRLKRDVYSGWLKLLGEEDERTFAAANNYASALNDANRFEEAKSLLRGTIPVARRVLGEGNELTITIKCHYSWSLYEDPGATLHDLREAVTTLEETTQAARRVLGGAHPVVASIENSLRNARALLAARDPPPRGP